MTASNKFLAAALMTAALAPIAGTATGSDHGAALENRAAPRTVAPAVALDVISFWREAGPTLWFAKDPDFDRRFRERFAPQYEAAARGSLDVWQQTPEGALALLVLLDQYPRNSFRETRKMYATDAHALRIARAAVNAGLHEQVEKQLRVFFVLPFAHSEQLADQDFAVQLAAALGPADLAHAEHHRDIVRRFGRFPHRNVILGRVTTAEEQKYLDNGGYRG